MLLTADAVHTGRELLRPGWIDVSGAVVAALAYGECVGDDVPYGKLTSFPRAVQATDDETVVFSWIVYASREARDEINAKVLADPRFDHTDMPFDGSRLIFGGFKTLVER